MLRQYNTVMIYLLKTRNIFNIWIAYWIFEIQYTEEISGDTFYLQGSTLISGGLSNYTHDEVWDEISYPFPNFNDARGVDIVSWLFSDCQ